jgi:hypothetical protein
MSPKLQSECLLGLVRAAEIPLFDSHRHALASNDDQMSPTEADDSAKAFAALDLTTSGNDGSV